ncbi:MAG: DUF4363 family protein [Ruminococcaceae bacterium]|nr:DUF4363 family protein [Oscillospiraceae bacterium]
MKAFVISLVVLTLILAATIFNSIYIFDVTSSLIDCAESLKIDDDSVFAFKEKWEKVQFLIRLSSSHKETHRIDEVLGVLEEKVNNKTENGFVEERALLIEYITQIQEDEKVSIDSII